MSRGLHLHWEGVETAIVFCFSSSNSYVVHQTPGTFSFAQSSMSKDAGHWVRDRIEKGMDKRGELSDRQLEGRAHSSLLERGLLDWVGDVGDGCGDIAFF